MTGKQAVILLFLAFVALVSAQPTVDENKSKYFMFLCNLKFYWTKLNCSHPINLKGLRHGQK